MSFVCRVIRLDPVEKERKRERERKSFAEAVIGCLFYHRMARSPPAPRNTPIFCQEAEEALSRLGRAVCDDVSAVLHTV